MKITCISTSRVPSDTANSIQVMKACQALQQIGHDVELLLPGGESASWEPLAGRYGLTTPFRVTWLPARPQLRRYDFAWQAVRRARRPGVELIYTWTLQAALISLYHNLPVVLEMHGPPEGTLGPRLFGVLLGHSGKKRLAPITQALAEILEQDYQHKFNPSEFVIAPNGVDLERYTDLPGPQELRRELGLSGKIVAGYTGHLYPGRGMDLLLELARRHPGVQFVWVGGRPEDVAHWKSRQAEAGVHNVQMTGFIENVHMPRYQAAMDILLMPYEKSIEGSGGGDSAAYASPMKMFEYLAAGRAIVSSELPPIREVLDDNTAIFCEPEDPDAWSAAVGVLATDPERIRALGENARRQAQKYTWAARQKRILDRF